MDWENERVFITGAGGFIGSHLTEAVAGKGARVTALVHYNSSHACGWLDQLPAESKKKVKILLGDVRDAGAVRKMLKRQTIVFHLAALIGIPYSYMAPESYVETNVIGSLNMLEGALLNGVRKFIHTSTSEVYGSAQYVPMDEAHPLQGQSPYSASKIGADKLAESYWRAYALPVVTVRPFNTYGPRQSRRAVIPTIISQALTKREVRLGSLEPVRDFVFVKDTVAGFLAAAEKERLTGETVHLGSGKGISVGDLVMSVSKLMDKKVRVVVQNQRKRPAGSEVVRLIADPSKARRLLQWRALTPLREGLRETISWIKEHEGEYEGRSFAY